MICVTLSQEGRLLIWEEAEAAEQPPVTLVAAEPIQRVWLINSFGAALASPVRAFEWTPED